MKINIRADSVTVEGYVNAVERNSKPLTSRIGRFVERICKGAFGHAIERNEDIHVLLNHDWKRDLGSTSQGNLELKEDSIGLYARAEITDKDVIEDARHGNLVGWSFGFEDTEGGVDKAVDDETGLPLRKVRDMNLYEVSILNRKKNPAYDGTLIMARDDSVQFNSEPFIDDVEVIEERSEEQTEEQAEEKEIDYSKWEEMISEMKLRYNHVHGADGRFGTSSGSSGGSGGSSGGYFPYKGFHEQANKLSESLKKARSSSAIQRIALSDKRQIDVIDKELQNPEDKDHIPTLKSAKYKLNRIIKDCEKKF